MAFMRLFEFALLFWIPFFILIYNIKQWKWSVAKMVGWIVAAAAAAGVVTVGVLTLIVLFN